MRPCIKSQGACPTLEGSWSGLHHESRVSVLGTPSPDQLAFDQGFGHRLYEAAEGIDILVHLAAVPDRDDFNQELVPNNIFGTHNVFEVARLRSIRRVVYASRCRVVGGLD